MEFKNYLKINAQKVETELNKILEDFLKETKKTDPKLLPFAKALVSSCQGGKRIRGVLVKLGYEIARTHLRGVHQVTAQSHLGGEVLKIGAALEILHAAILIHDDVIDQSPTRRTQPSLYKALGGGHYGESQAISMGDIGLYLPLKIISETKFNDKNKLKAIKHLSEVVIKTGWGQVLDIKKDDDWELLYKLKTAQYTISGPLQMGAILAGEEKELLGVLGIFGENLGIAFQIQDDILDGEVESVEKAKVKQLPYISQAKKMIPKITNDKMMNKLLEDMTEYMVERTH